MLLHNWSYDGATGATYDGATGAVMVLLEVYWCYWSYADAEL